MHALWLNDETQYIQAKQLIDEYQLERSRRIRLETQQKVENGEYEIHTTLIYNDLIEDCEKIGDHIFNISETITGEGK